jgi:hypothetical protein
VKHRQEDASNERDVYKGRWGLAPSVAQRCGKITTEELMGKQKTMTPQNVILGAIRLLRKGWAKGSGARDRNGHGCNYDSPEATSWCAEGALRRASIGHAEAYLKAQSIFEAVVGTQQYGNWNDNQASVELVIAAMQKAIQKLCGEE